MRDAVHRILAGWPLLRREKRAVRILAAACVLMFIAQWLDWLIGKF